jgi:hypothetical protein
MATTELFAEDNDKTTGAELHAARTDGLTEAEKTIFNDGYLYASADAVDVISRVLQEPDLTDAERVEIFEEIAGQMSLPLLIASLASGKSYIK